MIQCIGISECPMSLACWREQREGGRFIGASPLTVSVLGGRAGWLAGFAGWPAVAANCRMSHVPRSWPRV